MSQIKATFFLALRDLFQLRLWVSILLPLGVLTGLGLLVGSLFWDEALDGVMGWLASLSVIEAAQDRLNRWFGGTGWLVAFISWLVGFVLLLMVLLVLALVSVVLASALLAPWVAADVAKRHHPHLQRRGDLGFWRALMWSLKALAKAGLLLLLCVPIWFVPLVHVLVPPLIVGWLNSRVMSFDVLSNFASLAELQQLQREHRRALHIMGVLAGLLGVAPAVTWVSGLLFVALFVVLMPLAVLIYLAVLVFTALWFAHFCLQALQVQRQAESVLDGMQGSPLIKEPL